MATKGPTGIPTKALVSEYHCPHCRQRRPVFQARNGELRFKPHIIDPRAKPQKTCPESEQRVKIESKARTQKPS